MFMLDTNMCIYVINERDPSLSRHFEAHADALCISSICFAELAYGVAHSGRVKDNRRELAAFVKDLAILPFDQAGAEHYGDIRHALTKKGSPIGANDLLIAAHARSIDATLVTNNEREFRRVPKLSVNNWLKEANA
jgi:tRNA(fMet)-specific endonuclease VapC